MHAGLGLPHDRAQSGTPVARGGPDGVAPVVVIPFSDENLWIAPRIAHTRKPKLTGGVWLPERKKNGNT